LSRRPDRSKTRIVVVLLIATLASAAAVVPARAQKMPRPEPREGLGVGDRPFDVALKDLEGRPHSLKELRGKSVVHLVFWATWCVPCMQEIPAIDAAYAKYRAQGFEVLAVVLNINQTPDGVRAIARDYKVGYPVLWDGEGRVMNRYRVSMIPQNFLIGRDGLIRYAGTGLPGDYEGMIERLLQDGASGAPARATGG
jgi:cytochrome c biogenesis protein CcmG/thiol:disulfide interchange protein DsbE